MKLNWNFPGRGGGGGGGKTNNLPWGGVWIFSGMAHFKKIAYWIYTCKYPLLLALYFINNYLPQKRGERRWGSFGWGSRGGGTQ